ncbi:TonB-dependent receptor plug domain-containing protein [Halioxenophilus aromaticivorans]|uniref:TonB-dependent receptor n=1 Tax=Halioxenophilus aromaticivorans TaxID=1306992 RepID=A0AAV3U1V5_9ALTE
MTQFKSHILPITIAAVCAQGFAASTVFAQDAANAALEELVVTGNRAKPRTVSDSPVPIDVFNSEQISSVSYTDTNDILQTLVPSYSVSRVPIGDGATFIRPASLRGMPTDKTLVLVNGKRRHRAALVEIGGSGTQGPDVATIPGSALQTVEVLRDGAAALYGSDAIAGVINFILKDNSEGGSLSVDYGEYFEGDGESVTVTGNIGLPLGESGFFSLSGEYSSSDFTSRSEQYCESWFCVTDQSAEYQAAAANASLESDVVQPWGAPNSEGTRLFFNAGLPLTDTAELYAFGNYSESEADGGFYYRYPGNGTIMDLRNEDGSIYSPLEKFPGGFTPRFFGEVTDYSLAGGIKGEFTSELSYDISARYGYDEISYTLKNTINPSLGAASPTSFKPGDLSNEEIQLQADFVYLISDTMAMSFGASYMEESYDITGGEESSYTAGPYATEDPYNFCNDDGTPTAAGIAVSANGLNCADPSDPVYQVVGVGSNGFPGYSPEYSGTYERDSFALYVDLEKDVTDSLLVKGALRYEDYSDFDSELVGQVAMQYDVTDTFGIRGSVGTGFRAPTPGQQGTTNVSTRLPDGQPVATGLFPASGAVAQALGASDLEPETSTNFTFGMTGETGPVSWTLDFYRIEVQDRTYAISTLDVGTDPTDADAFANFQALEAAGVQGANTIGGVFYFTNAFDTVTNGIDFVATMPLEWDNGGLTDLSLSVNYNQSEFDSDPSEFLNIEDTYDFENMIPEWRGVLSARHTMEAFSFLVRANVYGSYTNSNNNGPDDADGNATLTYQEFDPIVQFDLEGSYQFNDNLSLTVGGRNIFDEYPEEDEIGDYCCGAKYPTDTIVSWQGGYYFARLNYDF